MSSDPDGSTPHGRPGALRVRHDSAMLTRSRTTQDRIADAITSFSGTLRFVYIHAVWFAIWIAINLGAFGRSAIFDEFPFGLLTMIVSLEAIFLSTFVMISQNRQAARDKARSDQDFENNVRSEVWSIHIGKKLGVDPELVERRVQELIAQSNADISGKPAGPRLDPRDL